MNIEQLLTGLDSVSTRNNALDFLVQIIVDTDPRLINGITKIVSEPETITNTNRFASALKFLSEDDFIAPLIAAISKADVDCSPWLADYMYALGSLLTDRDDPWEPEESFVHQLGLWLHSTGGGEIAWKSAIIMSRLLHPLTRDYLVRGALDQELLHLARIECINGIMNFFRSDANQLLEKLENDPDKEIRKEVARAQEWLSGHDHRLVSDAGSNA